MTSKETAAAEDNFAEEATDRFGVLPALFRTASAASGLIEEQWTFAKSAYFESPLPSPFKERLFVHLSRFCEVRYCILRQIGFLVGQGRKAGDLTARQHTIEQALRLLRRPVPEAAALDRAFLRLEAHQGLAEAPLPETPEEADLFDALTVIFLAPQQAGRARDAVRKAVGEARFEILTALLASIRTAHYWTETHPDVAVEPDMIACMEQNPELARLLMDASEAPALGASAQLREALRILQRAEGSSRESEEKYAALFRASPAPFLILKPDAPRFTIVEVNDAYLAATMRRREDVVGRGVFEAFPDNPEDAAIAGVSALRASFERVLATRQPETLPGLKYDIARPDGTFEERWWSPVNSAVLDDKGEVEAIIHNANDVTAERRAELALRESEERQAFLLKLSDAMRAERDAEAIASAALRLLCDRLHLDRAYMASIRGADRPVDIAAEHSRPGLPPMPRQLQPADFPKGFKMASEGVLVVDDIWRRGELTDLDRHSLDAIGLTAFIVAPLNRGAAGMIWALVAGSREPRDWTHGEAVLVTEAAERIWAAVERARAETALGRSEELLHLGFEAAEMGAWDYDLAAEVCHFDARAQKLYSLSCDAIDHSPEGIAAVVHPDDVRPMFDAVERASDVSGDGRYGIDYRIAQRDGRYRWLRAWGKADFKGEGAARRAVRIVGASRDVTLEKEAQDRLASELAAARQLQAFSTGLISEQQPDALYQQLLNAAMALMNADAASMQMLHPERGRDGELRLLASRGFTPEADKFWEWVDAGSGTTCGMALLTGARSIAADVETCDFTAGTADRAVYLRAGIRAVQSTPLVSRSGLPLGMLSTHWFAPHEPSEGDFRLFDVLARQAADLIERTQAEKRLRESEANLLVALNVGRLGSWQLDLSTGILTASEKCKANFGYGPDQPFGYEELRSAIHPDDRERQGQAVANAVEAKASFEIEYRAITPGRELRWIGVRGRYDRDGPGPRLIGVSQDITERKRDEQRMLGQRHVLEMVAAGASLQDTLDDLMRFIEAQEPGARCGILIVADDGRHFRRGSGPSLPESYHSALDGVPITPPYLGSCGEAANERTAVLVPDVANETRYADQWRDMLLACGMKAGRSTPVCGADGRVLASIAIYYDRPRDPNPADPQLIDIAAHLAAIAIERDRDLSAQAAARERQRLLIDELNHRVKNTLATIQSIAGQTLRNAATPAEGREALETRLIALANAHDVLTRENWEGANVREIVASAMSAYTVDGAEQRIRIEGPDIRLLPRAALAIAMGLHELATNAAKYGALSNATGRVSISWKVRAEAPELFDLRWAENGGPPVKEPRKRGFGSRLVERGLAQDLGGRIELGFPRSGVVCAVEAPIEEIRAGGVTRRTERNGA